MSRKITQLKRITLSGLIIAMMATAPLSAQVEFSEDFTNPSKDWLFFGTNQADTLDAPQNWSIADGELGSFGKFYQNGWNYACHETNSPDGPWSFDVRIRNHKAFSFRVSTFPEELSSGYDTFSPAFQVVHGGTSDHISLGQLQAGIWQSLDEVPILAEGALRHFVIERNDTEVTVKVNGTETLSATLSEQWVADYNAICMWTKTGSNSSIDNIQVGTTETSDATNSGFLDHPLFAVLAGMVLLAGFSYLGATYVKKKRIRRLAIRKVINQQILETTQKEFHLSDSSMVSLVSGLYQVDEQYTTENFQELIPQELLTYRYLMQPTRLTIMKLLAHQQKMRSHEIRHLLDISWGEYSNHIKSLEEKGYVELVDEFNEQGHVVQVVYITAEGNKEFLALFELLQQFVSHLSPVAEFIREGSDDDSLYPKF